MENLKTSKGLPVIIGKIYELKYKWGDGYNYGYGWINPKKQNNNYIDIILHDGGVTYQHPENVVFLKQYKA